MLKKASLIVFKKAYNSFIDLLPKKHYLVSELKELDEIKKYSRNRSDISDHLVKLFTESLNMNPKLIVELGVRSGESTFVFERVAKLCNSKIISIDIEDCSHVSNYKNWIFVQRDDIEFAKEFKSWCRKHKINPEIDILFIDTSHLFAHTRQEIKLWFPFLAKKTKVIFHDTNIQEIYLRKDGSMGLGWNNKRGVIRGLEDYFKVRFDETQEFVDFRKDWLIKHYPYCNGFTILERRST